MNLKRSTLISIVVLLLWLLITWRLAHFIAPHPPVLYYLRTGFILVGVIGFAGYLWLRPKEHGEVQQGWTAMANAEIEFSFAEASKHMQTVGVKNINTLPAVFILGDGGTAKTSVIAKSGLEPDLLAGYAYENYVIAPTKSLNLWFARQTLYIDPAGAVIADPIVRKKLFKKFAPVKLKSVLGGKQPPPRSVVFTVDCDTFLQTGSGEALTAKARQFQTILGELSEELGSNFPVYVLFTKTDKMPYFRDFVSNFTEAEATEIFGKTLPLQTATERGVYAEQETRRLTDAFQDLYFTLCDRRPEQLSRENTAGQLPNIYEFPREFAKLRPLLVQFLVDLCRPTQLRTSPFLRGFYFTGVRPVSVPDLAPSAVAPVAEEQGFDSGATRIFSGRSNTPKMQGEVLQSGSRRVPQWVFLTHLFSDLILVDQPAMVATRGSVKLDIWRRALLAGASALAIFLMIWWIVSYGNNKALVRDASASAKAVPGAGLASGQIASLDSLQRLDKVRDTLALLQGYEKEGAPFEYGGGLYAGSSILQPLRTTYYALFRKLLLSPTQDALRALCLKPDDYQAKGYRYIYDALKAYLITTNHHEKSTREFLTPALMEHWRGDQQVDGERTDLAKRDFDFYADELPEANPYPRYSTPDSTAVETARAYLNKFEQKDRIYEAMLTAAGAGLEPIIFNDQFPESRGLILNKYRVDPAFTKKGYAAFMKDLKDPERYFQGEEWVLGPHSLTTGDQQALLKELTERYNAEFIKTWREYLHATSFAGYGNLADMVVKLGRLSANNSPLLEVMCLASENTAVESKESPALAKEITDTFQPLQVVTPPGCILRPNSQANAAYIQALIGLQGAVETLQKDQSSESAIASAQSAESQGENVARQLSTGFNRDTGAPPVDSKTSALLLDPLKGFTPPNPDLEKAKAAGKAVCVQADPLFNKYPFNHASKSDATLPEVSQLLKPGDGKIFDPALAKILTRAGNDFVATPGGTVKVTPAFLAFMNRMLHLSNSLFKGGNDPNLNFSMQPVATPDVDHITLIIDGVTLSQETKSVSKQTFVWPGTTQNAVLKVRIANSSDLEIVNSTGLWAIWRFLDSSDVWQSVGNQVQVQWNPRTGPGPIMGPHGPVQVKFQLDPEGSEVFRKNGFMPGTCPGPAAVKAGG